MQTQRKGVCLYVDQRLISEKKKGYLSHSFSTLFFETRTLVKQFGYTGWLAGPGTLLPPRP